MDRGLLSAFAFWDVVEGYLGSDGKQPGSADLGNQIQTQSPEVWSWGSWREWEGHGEMNRGVHGVVPEHQVPSAGCMSTVGGMLLWSCTAKSYIFVFIYLFIYLLAVPHVMQDLSSPTRD